MALLEFQRLLLRVYTDPSLQERLCAGTLPGIERLSPQERAALRGIPRPALEQFQRAVAAKRLSSMRRRLERIPGRVICSDFSAQGPILLFGKDRIAPISPEAARLARNLFERREPLSFSALVRAYRADTNVSLRSVLELGWALNRHGLKGRYVICA